jgi:hypothetical protein
LCLDTKMCKTISRNDSEFHCKRAQAKEVDISPIKLGRLVKFCSRKRHLGVHCKRTKMAHCSFGAGRTSGGSL